MRWIRMLDGDDVAVFDCISTTTELVKADSFLISHINIYAKIFFFLEIILDANLQKYFQNYWFDLFNVIV